MRVLLGAAPQVLCAALPRCARAPSEPPPERRAAPSQDLGGRTASDPLPLFALLSTPTSAGRSPIACGVGAGRVRASGSAPLGVRGAEHLENDLAAGLSDGCVELGHGFDVLGDHLRWRERTG